MSTYIVPWLDQPLPSTSTTSRNATTPRERPEFASTPVVSPIFVPNEEGLTLLMGMGFDREAVIQALRQSDNDVNRASNVLLDGNW